MENYSDIINKVLNEYQDRFGDIEYRSYGEDDERMLLVYNWDDMEKIDEMIGEELVKIGEITQEELDAEKNVHCREKFVDMVGLPFGFTDEYVVCDYCYKIVPRMVNYINNVVVVNSDEWMCSNCAIEYPDVYLEYIKESPTERLNQYLSENTLSSFGYKKLDTVYENGLYDRTDDPKDSYRKLKEKYSDVIFNMVSCNPYAIEWEAWVKDEEANK